MKKLLISILVLTLTTMMFVNHSQAQSRNVTVNLNLKDVMSSGGEDDGGTATGANEVTFDFETEEDYRKGQVDVVKDQLRVLSTKKYKIELRSETAEFISTTTPANKIALSVLKVSASLGDEDDYGTAVSPETTAKTIFSNGDATLAQSFDIKYEIPPSLLLIQAPKEKYSVKLIFTIAAQ